LPDTAAGGESGGSAPASRAPARGPLPSMPSDASGIGPASPLSSTSPPPATLNDLSSAAGAAAAQNPALQTGASSAAQPGTAVTVAVHAEVGGSGWANELGARLHWMVGAGLGSASLRLTPEQLGPVEVRISVHQNSASVWFSAAQPDTRSALEQALPRLRELFSAQGLNLAQAGVSDQSARSAQREPQTPGAGVRTLASGGPSATSVTSLPRLHQGLIDTYA
jgi:flagellar hook-length control protein FliK